MSNKYIARLVQDSPKASLTSKIGLGVSATSLGVGGANFYNNHKSNTLETQRVNMEKERLKLQEEQRKLDEKSLAALRGIDRKLAGNPTKA